ncbi:MAG: cbb3-type cytochrome c oxidase subunit I [Nitrospirae bacterium]|nr:cbb3-type cytochrome c oxidase subunit I [Nitrospirota bacterium]
MEKIVVWYLRMSIIYFIAGALIGLVMILSPGETGYYVSSHTHLNLLGFMSMMIYGVGYHILPKFSGRNIYSPMIMHLQFWIGNAGLTGMVAGWLVLRGDVSHFSQPVLILSALLSLTSVVLFAFNILKTIKAV